MTWKRDRSALITIEDSSCTVDLIWIGKDQPKQRQMENQGKCGRGEKLFFDLIVLASRGWRSKGINSRVALSNQMIPMRDKRMINITTMSGTTTMVATRAQRAETTEQKVNMTQVGYFLSVFPKRKKVRTE